MAASLIAIDRWKDLQVEDYFHLQYEEGLRWFMDITFGISLMLYIFTAYTILTQSPKQMGAFKYTVFTQVTLNMLYKVGVFLFNPVIVFPLPVIVCFNYFHIPSTSIVIVALGVIFFVIIAAGIAILFSVINRVLAAFDTKTLNKSKINFSLGVLAFLVITLIIFASVMVPLILIVPILDKSLERLKTIVPSVNDLHRLVPNTFGADPADVGDMLMIFVIIAISWTFIYTTAFISLNIIVVYQLRKLKNIVSKTTYSIHKMLHTALLVQTINLIFFAVVPIILIVTVFLLQLPNGSWFGNLSVPLSSLHLIIDAPSLLHFIKPYRRFVLRLFCRKKDAVSLVEGFTMAQRRLKLRNLSIVGMLDTKHSYRSSSL